MSRFVFISALAMLMAGPSRAADRPIQLLVDATEAPRRLIRATLSIPAAPGPLTLYYPKWVQGEHSPNGPIADLSALKIDAGGKALAWLRDEIDLHAFHLTVPEGADAIFVSLEYLAPWDKGDRSTRVSATSQLAFIHWRMFVLYPKGRAVRDIPIRAQLHLPEGWQAGTALPFDATIFGRGVSYKTVSLETLADSPVLCGRHFKEFPLGGDVHHSLVVACDSAAGLGANPALIEQYRRLIAESRALFGSRHYNSYRFLIALSDQIKHGATENHESSHNRLPERFFIDDTYRKQWTAWVLPHEYVHSWNGKYRRPAGLDLPDFQQPYRTKLLWVYEGLTEYLGFVLTARAGLYTPEQSRENFALIADWAKHQGGRAWRTLADTAVAAPFLFKGRSDWESRRRGVDFYDEGALLWLDADTLIREKTGGKKSLDDFCKAFFGGVVGPPEVKPYEIEDVIAALNGVIEYDWKAFLDRRLMTVGADVPQDGIARGGWKLTYRVQPGDLFKANDDEEKTLTLRSSLGFIVKEDGGIVDVFTGSPADKAKVGPGMKLLAVNGRRFNVDRLRQAVAATKSGETRLNLLFENGDYIQSYALDYSGGPRYPHLERIAAAPDILSAIFAPRSSAQR